MRFVIYIGNGVAWDDAFIVEVMKLGELETIAKWLVAGSGMWVGASPEGQAAYVPKYRWRPAARASMSNRVAARARARRY